MSFDCGARRIGALAVTTAVALAAFTPLSYAQRKTDTAGYPSRPVRSIVPYAPGGGTDIMARALAQKLSAAWNQQVVVDNRGGGATIVGTDLAAKSPPDGYTLLITSTSFVINPTVQPKLPYDTLRDFQPVTQIAFHGLYTPAGVPSGIVSKIHDDAVRVLQSGDMRDKLAADGAEPAAARPKSSRRSCGRRSPNGARSSRPPTSRFSNPTMR